MNVGAVFSSGAIAMTGLRDASLRLGIAAHNVANVASDGFRPLQVTSVEIPTGGVRSVITQSIVQEANLAMELVAAIVAEAAFAANARVFQQTQRLERSALDVLA
jgi:flagellar basal-body rod protein FlgC